MPYGPYAPEARLRRVAAARIADERLPLILAAIIRPRHGSDEICQVCGRQIDRYRVEYQVTDPRDGCELAFHLMCYRIWQAECQRMLVARRGTLDRNSAASFATRRSSSRPW